MNDIDAEPLLKEVKNNLRGSEVKMAQESQEKVELVDNPLKWSSIDLMLNYLFKDDQPLTINDLKYKMRNTPVTLTQKYDGTNIGVDEFGEIYGRNKMVPAN